MRSYALGNPGLAAASFRNPQIDSAEWQDAGNEMAQTILRVFSHCGLEGESAHHAVRILRSLVRGFILNEMASDSSQPLERVVGAANPVPISVNALIRLVLPCRCHTATVSPQSHRGSRAAARSMTFSQIFKSMPGGTIKCLRYLTKSTKTCGATSSRSCGSGIRSSSWPGRF
ncbi:MAG: WHG domain-containing protein, partial [Afipia sp.]|nr:WHG domain-containing protein [Afipia sp.]